MLEWVKNNNSKTKEKKVLEEFQEQSNQLIEKVHSPNETVRNLSLMGLGQVIISSILTIQREEMNQKSIFVEKKIVLIEKLLDVYTEYHGSKCDDLGRLLQNIKRIRQKNLNMSEEEYDSLLENERMYESDSNYKGK